MGSSTHNTCSSCSLHASTRPQQSESMPVPVWEASDSFTKYELLLRLTRTRSRRSSSDLGLTGEMVLNDLPNALTDFFAAFHSPQPAQLAAYVMTQSAADFVIDDRISFNDYLKLLHRHRRLLPSAYRNELAAVHESLHGNASRGDQSEVWGIAEFFCPESRPNKDVAMANMKQQAAAGGSGVADPLLSPNSRCRADSDTRFNDLICEAQATLRQKVSREHCQN